MSVRFVSRLTGSTLIMALILMSILPTVFATEIPGNAIFQGRVVAEDGVSPIEGVVIKLAMRETGTLYSSSPSNRDGAFRLDTAPEGTYAVLAQAADGAYLAAESIQLKSGQNQQVAVMIRPQAELAPAQGGASSLPLWGKIVIGGTLTLAALAIIDGVSNDSEPAATPF
jgi:hypothetical protein